MIVKLHVCQRYEVSFIYQLYLTWSLGPIFYFYNFSYFLKVEVGRFDLSSTAWQFEDVKEIIHRRYQLQERALEIFLLNGQTYLVAFQSAEVITGF